MCLYNLPVFNYILIVCEACVFFPLTPSWACVCRFLRYGCARTASHYSVSVGNIGWAWSDRRALPAALCLQFFFFFFFCALQFPATRAGRMGGAPATKTQPSTAFPPNAQYANEALLVGGANDRARHSVNSFIATLLKRTHAGGLCEQNNLL